MHSLKSSTFSQIFSQHNYLLKKLTLQTTSIYSIFHARRSTDYRIKSKQSTCICLTFLPIRFIEKNSHHNNNFRRSASRHKLLFTKTMFHRRPDIFFLWHGIDGRHFIKITNSNLCTKLGRSVGFIKALKGLKFFTCNLQK